MLLKVGNVKCVYMMKTITLVSLGKRQAEQAELHRLEAADQCMRVSLYGNTLNSDLLDEKYLKRVPRMRRLLYKPLPGEASQVLEAFMAKGRYDAVISWGEHLGLPFAMLLKLTTTRVPHVAIFSWISKRKKATLLKLAHSHIDRLILMSSVQRDFAVQRLGIPLSKIAFLRWPVDQKFWRPMNVEADMICAVGREMRDYGTLIRAIWNLYIPCHIAAGGDVEAGKKDAWKEAIEEAGPIPPHISLGKKNYVELRELYGRSRFVVIPLLPTDTDNGTTSILEAMAMGKAVICSKAKGQVDVIQDGRTGLYVQTGDPKALRDAIQYLWDHPDEAERMGKAGREYIEKNHTLDQFVGNLKAIVEEVISEYKNS
jgi:glycosyltransferase involved in cell wall biosynthesis